MRPPRSTVGTAGTLATDGRRTLETDRIARRSLELVRTSSETGDEAAAIDLVASWLEGVADDIDRWTTPMAELEADPDYPGREVERADVPVVAATIRGDRPGPTTVLTGHVDVVPVGDPSSWTMDPSGAIDGDLLYGRGAADMKAGVAAAVEAFSSLAGGDRRFAGEVRLVAVPGEEDGGTGTLAAIRRGWSGDHVIITEPTSGPLGPDIVVAHGGALTFTIEVRGRGAHAAKRLEGESALDHFLTVYAALGRLERDLNEIVTNPMMAALVLPYPTTVGIVRGGTWASNVMESVTAEARVGVAVGESIPDAEARFESHLLDAVADDEWLVAHPPRIERTGAAFGSAEIEPSHPLVIAIEDASAEVTGRRPRPIGVPYGCDMAMWSGVGGAATTVFGPGDVAHAHAADERVSLSEAAAVAATLESAVRRLHA